MRRVRCLTVGAGTAWESAFVASCSDPHSGVEVVGRCVELGELLARLRVDPPEAVVCDIDVAWLDADTVAAIDACGAAALGVAQGAAASRGTRLGLTAVVPPADVTVIAGAVVEAARPLEPTPPRSDHSPEERGVVVAVWGPKGGTGRTTVAVNLAWELADQGADCVLVDADTYGGSVALALDLPERPNVASIARSLAGGSVLGSADLESLARPAPRLGVLAGLARAEAWTDLRGSDLARLLAALRAHAQVVVVDVGACLEDAEELLLSASPWRRNQATLAALGGADRVYAVVACDPASVRHAVLQAGDLAAAIGAEGRVHTIANRAVSRRTGRQVLDELDSRCGWVPDTVLVDDPGAIEAMWAGRSLGEAAGRSRLRRGVSALAAGLGADWAAGRLHRRPGPVTESVPAAVAGSHEVPP